MNTKMIRAARADEIAALALVVDGHFFGQVLAHQLFG